MYISLSFIKWVKQEKIICYFISVLRKLYLAKRAVCVFIAYPGLYNWITLKHVSFI